MFDLGKVWEGLKLSPKYLAALALATGVLLFGPPPLLGRLGVAAFVGTYRAWIGFAFLVTASILLIHMVLIPWGGFSRWFQDKRLRRDLSRRLRDLTPAEKGVLRGFISGNTRSQTLDLLSGVVSGLESARIIYRASSAGLSMRFDYNMHPWAWDYLRKHDTLLLSGPEDKPPGRGRPTRG